MRKFLTLIALFVGVILLLKFVLPNMFSAKSGFISGAIQGTVK